MPVYTKSGKHGRMFDIGDTIYVARWQHSDPSELEKPVKYDDVESVLKAGWVVD